MQPEKKNFFVELILPLALPATFTYHVPENLRNNMIPGQRVVVQFGKQKIYSALVWKINAAEPDFETKPVMSIVDELPVINRNQMQFWQWISDYYICTLGEVMAAALPSALRLQSESTLRLNESFTLQEELNERESIVVEALQDKKLTLAEASKLLNLKQVMPVIKSLLLRNIIEVEESLEDKYKPKIESFVSFTEEANDEAFLEEVMASLEKRSPKQLDLLLCFIRLSQDEDKTAIAKTLLLKRSQAGASALSALVKKGVLKVQEHAVDRINEVYANSIPPLELSSWQQDALKSIKESFNAKKVSLLHGITSSGKTEIYIHLLNDALLNKKQALYLLPEIALTTQVITRLRKHFGSSLLVYHSRFTDNERVEIWNKVLAFNGKEGMIVIGARSAVFLPYSDLELIIVDEEHDTGFKQSDPAPRYHARDAAVYMASFMNSNVLLGSATPSLESYYNALSGKYILTELERRHGDWNMPSVKIVDVRDALKRKQMHSHFSSQLLEEIKSTVVKGEQVILFQNRRGFAPILECRNCSWVPHCINCDVSLTLHKYHSELRCHYCGYSTKPPSSCNACGSADLRMKGFGTEKIEEELQLLFPDQCVARLDHDTAKSRKNFQRLISDFESGEIDVLVGTQMVTKGLDFKKVNLVGILNADQLLNFPDFRAHERSFQLMEQVSGRAGRKNNAGRVVIQTYNPSNHILQFVLNHDYKSFYRHELNERHKYNYPPYFRLIECIIRHRDEGEADRAALEFADELKPVFGKRVLGPTNPNISRIRNYYIRKILLKLERKLSVGQVKRELIKAINLFTREQINKSVILHIDVDPQ